MRLGHIQVIAEHIFKSEGDSDTFLGACGHSGYAIECARCEGLSFGELGLLCGWLLCWGVFLC
jgi:hypothetical protein